MHVGHVLGMREARSGEDVHFYLLERGVVGVNHVVGPEDAADDILL